MKLVDEICPMFGNPCRHCSDEIVREIVRFSIIKDCELGKKGHQGKRIRRIELGCFCNNDGKHFVKDMKYCPARWALTRPMTDEAKELVKELLRANASIIVSKAIKKAIRKAVRKATKKPKAEPAAKKKKPVSKKPVKKSPTKKPDAKKPAKGVPVSEKK